MQIIYKKIFTKRRLHKKGKENTYREGISTKKRLHQKRSIFRREREHIQRKNILGERAYIKKELIQRGNTYGEENTPE